MERATASFAIDTETLESFRRAVLHRHGKLHGRLAQEAALALQARTAALLSEEVGHD